MFLSYFLAWFGMMVLAIANGALREAALVPRMGEARAHVVSTLTLLALLAAYFWILFGIWPLHEARDAWIVGIVWTGMTIGFEVGLGRILGDKPWGKLLADYNVFRGRVWILVPLWVLVGPWVFHRPG